MVLISPGYRLVPGGSLHPMGAKALCSHDAAEHCGGSHVAGFIR